MDDKKFSVLIGTLILCGLFVSLTIAKKIKDDYQTRDEGTMKIIAAHNEETRALKVLTIYTTCGKAGGELDEEKLKCYER